MDEPQAVVLSPVIIGEAGIDTSDDESDAQAAIPNTELRWAPTKVELQHLLKLVLEKTEVDKILGRNVAVAKSADKRQGAPVIYEHLRLLNIFKFLTINPGS